MTRLRQSEQSHASHPKNFRLTQHNDLLQQFLHALDAYLKVLAGLQIAQSISRVSISCLPTRNTSDFGLKIHHSVAIYKQSHFFHLQEN